MPVDKIAIENKEVTARALALEPLEWKEIVAEAGLPAYRARQVFAALQRGQIASWDELRQLNPVDRDRIAARAALQWPAIARRIVSSDGTVRYLLALADGQQVEAVYLPDEEFDGEGRLLRKRTTFCISSQVGCAVNCQFCLTATLGLKRSLTAAEIVGQVLLLLREHDLRPGSRHGSADRVNLVFMGQGEPFLNYANVVRAIRVLTHPEGAGMAARRITVSTAGIVEKIGRWSQEAFPHGRPRLAISLNASHDEQRQLLMPLHGGQGGMAALWAAVDAYAYQAREYLTFEYVLLAGVNDTPADAGRLVRLLAARRAKVNLIAWNSGGGLPFGSPEREQVLAFQARLVAGGVATYIRRPRGRDIYAACGQLSVAGLTSPDTTVRSEPSGKRTRKNPSESSPAVIPDQLASTVTGKPRA
ncbi:MAG: 23S rRNA (adenine(2503)-C(2))-methyltransferase RlmN [Terriglobales bacterium]